MSSWPPATTIATSVARARRRRRCRTWPPPPFAQKFVATSSQLAPLLIRHRVVATAQVANATLTSFTPSGAVALLSVVQSVSNDRSTASGQMLRVQLTLVYQGARWLLDNLTVVQ